MSLKLDGRTRKVVAIVAALTVVVAIGASNRRPEAEEKTYQVAYPTVGNLVRTVPGDGEIRTYRAAIVHSDVRAWGTREIIELVPQGTWVKKGDVVCVLDASEFQQRLSEPTLAVIADTARLKKAQADEVIQEYINARRTMNSEYAVKIAENKLRAFEQGEYPTQVGKLAGAVSMREDGYDQAFDQFQEMRRLAQNGIVSSASVAAARRRYESAEIELGQARGEVGLYEEFMYPRSMAQFSADAQNAVDELDRTALLNDVETSMAKVWTLSFRKYRSGWQEYVDYLTRAIEACTMRAPRDGQVVYFHDDDRRIELGSGIHYTQKVFTVSDRDRLAVAVKVSDRFYYALRKRQPVNIQVEALPGRLFSGTVTWLGPIPSRLNRYAPESLIHKVEILLDGSGDDIAGLFPGMTAHAEFIVDSRDDVLRVPVEAVVEHRGEYVVVVKDDSGLSRRVIETGISNDRVIEVLDGLTTDDAVVVDTVDALWELADSL